VQTGEAEREDRRDRSNPLDVVPPERPAFAKEVQVPPNVVAKCERGA
jgi:hypothetical protein